MSALDPCLKPRSREEVERIRAGTAFTGDPPHIRGESVAVSDPALTLFTVELIAIPSFSGVAI
jgi:hypothetical protein